MSWAPALVFRGQARHLLAATGLLPLTRRALGLYVDLRCASRRRFRVMIDGREVCFVTRDPHSKRFFHRRYRQGDLHEPPVTRALVRRARHASVFADVGAHVAYYSCVAGVANRALRLFLFEMNRDMIAVMERNLRRNGRTDAVIVDRPVADRQRLVSYPRASREPGLSMGDPIATEGGGHILVETISLDEFFAGQATWPDLIKIDVEGAELDVLRGARQIIAQHHPVMFVEVHPRLLGKFGASAEQVYAFLRAHGYTIQRFVGHRAHGAGLEPVAATAALPDGTHMLLCV